MKLAQYAVTVHLGGRTAREYGFDGRTFIVGRNGIDYCIRLSNHHGRRAKAVLAVDGLSVIDGKPASRNGSGYIIEPWSALDVPGWRINDTAVARFVFGGSDESYAAKLNKKENVGVIACAFFEDDRPVPVETTGPALAMNFDGAIAKTCSNLRGGSGSIGTGFGHKLDHLVRRTEFNARPEAAAILEIRYEDAAILRGMGLDVDDDVVELHAPTAFPADASGYCPPPRDWRG